MPYFDISASIPSVYTLNAEYIIQCNVLKVIQDYMKHDPSSTQIAKCSNENCSGVNHIRYSASIIINDLNEILNKGFTCLNMLLENYIKSESKPCIYKNCNGILHKEKKLGSHIFIETDQLDSSKCTIFLNEIPVDIILNNEKLRQLLYLCVAGINQSVRSDPLRGSHSFGDVSVPDIDVWVSARGTLKGATTMSVTVALTTLVARSSCCLFTATADLASDLASSDYPLLETNDCPSLATEKKSFVPGNGLYKFCKPTSVAVTTSGEFYVSVADGYCNSRIIKFSDKGRVLLEWDRRSILVTG
ncbi:hypothetical protein ACI65C_002301 [Semiaphis heraclei]